MPENSDRFVDWQHPEILDNVPTKYHWVVQGIKGFELGYQTDIGAYTYINAKHGVVIEYYVQIGSHCSIYSISTIDDKSGAVTLEKNCKIGSHTTIMPGVCIGENAIVGAHSFVTSDIPPNSVALGVPAKVIKTLESTKE